MPEKNKRRFFSAQNKFQTQIIMMTFFPPVIVYAFIFILLLLMHKDLVDVLLYNSPANNVQLVQQWSFLILVTLLTFFFFLMGWSFIISLNLVGAFSRIIRELDEIIETKEKRPIKARPNDELANELLKRINILIENQPDRR